MNSDYSPHALLWFDPRLATQPVTVINEAARRYREKFGVSPTVCYVNPMQRGIFTHPTIEIRTKLTILVDYLWIGKGKEKLYAPAQTFLSPLQVTG